MNEGPSTQVQQLPPPRPPRIIHSWWMECLLRKRTKAAPWHLGICWWCSNSWGREPVRSTRGEIWRWLEFKENHKSGLRKGNTLKVLASSLPFWGGNQVCSLEPGRQPMIWKVWFFFFNRKEQKIAQNITALKCWKTYQTEEELDFFC